MNGKGMKKWPVLFVRLLTHPSSLIATFAFVDSNSISTKVHLYKVSSMSILFNIMEVCRISAMDNW